MTDLPDRLLLARRHAKLSQREAADRAGISRATVTNAETGRHEVTLATLTALARVYGVDLDALLAPHAEDRTRPAEGAPETTQAPAPTAATR